ncbi:MAG: hypothetical protein D6729_03175, partial [Deltaproteobacteria bacterium]
MARTLTSDAHSESVSCAPNRPTAGPSGVAACVLRLALAAVLCLGGCVLEDAGSSGPKIERFATDRRIITSGTRGTERLQGQATLSWKAPGATEIHIRGDGAELDLSECMPGADGCAAEGSLVVRPLSETEYVLRACDDAGRCSESDPLTIETREPADGRLETDTPDVAPGSRVEVRYAIADAETWTLGVVAQEGGDLTLRPCDLESAATAESPCLLPESAPGVPATEGTAVLPQVAAPTTVALVATNGAEDGLGDYGLGDLQLRIETGGVGVLDFGPGDDTVVSGASVDLTWTVANATEVSVEAMGGTVSGLDGCTAVDEAGQGRCTVVVEADTSAGPVEVHFTLVARDAAGAESAPAIATVRVGRAPELFASVTPETLPDGGGIVDLSWQVTNRDGVTLGVVVAPEADAENPIVDTAQGVGKCQGEPCLPSGDVISLQVTTTTRWIVRASNEFGGTEVVVGVVVVGTPTIAAMRVDGVSVFEPGGALREAVVDASTATFEWETVRATETRLEWADSADCANPALAWTGVEFDMGAPSGIHTLQGINVRRRCYRLTASERLQGQSDRAIFRVVRRPVIDSFSVSDPTAAPGTSVQLAWTTRFATRVSVSSLPAGVDTSACTAPNGGCTVVLPGGMQGFVRFFLIAHNESADSMNQSVTVDVQPAPTVTFSAVDDADGDGQLPSGGGPVRLSWTTTGATTVRILDQDGTVVLDTAVPTSIASCPGGADAVGCEVAADTLVYTVTANTTWTLTAENAYGASSASARITVAGAPAITSLTVNGQNVLGLPGVVVESDDATFQWTTSNATSTRLERGDVPPGGCIVGTVSWGDYVGFPGTVSGTFTAGTHIQDWCYRFTASGAAGSDVHVFRVSRRPEIQSFDAVDATAAAGRSADFTWSTRFADRVEIVSVTGPSGDATSDFDLSPCTAVDAQGVGGCTLAIPTGEPLGTYTFELEAVGPSGARSVAATATVEIGEAPAIGSFAATPTVLPTGGGDVQLDWSGIARADDLELLQEGTVVYTEASPAASGAYGPVTVGTRTRFTLRVTNVYAATESVA